jgi:hypothetical protein
VCACAFHTHGEHTDACARSYGEKCPPPCYYTHRPPCSPHKSRPPLPTTPHVQLQPRPPTPSPHIIARTCCRLYRYIGSMRHCACSQPPPPTRFSVSESSMAYACPRARPYLREGWKAGVSTTDTEPRVRCGSLPGKSYAGAQARCGHARLWHGARW